MNLVGPCLLEELRKLADLDLVARATARRVDEDNFDRAQLIERSRHLGRVVDHRKRQVDDLGIGLELLDRRDPVSIDRDQPDSRPLGQLEVRRQLRDRRCLADSRRADQRNDPPRSRDRPDRRRNRDTLLDAVAQGRADRFRYARARRARVGRKRIASVAGRAPRARRPRSIARRSVPARPAIPEASDRYDRAGSSSRPPCATAQALRRNEPPGRPALRQRGVGIDVTTLAAPPPSFPAATSVGIVSLAVTTTTARDPRPKSLRRRTSRAERITASPPKSRRTRVIASFIVLARYVFDRINFGLF